MSTTTASNFWQRWSPLIAILLSAILFDGLFWERALGFNLLLFVLLIVAVVVHRHSWKALSVPARLTMFGAIIAALMVYVHNSVIANIVVILTLGAFTALAHEPALRSLFFAGAQLFGNYLMVPLAAAQSVDEVALSRGASRKGWRWTKLTLVPLLVLIVFFQLYRSGNPKFEHLTAGFLDGLWESISELMERVFTAHTLFFLFGAVLCAGLLYRFVPRTVLQMEERLNDVLVRTRLRRASWLAPRSMDPLERERRMGVILLVAVNLLLLVVNVIDVSWVWVGFEVPEGFSLKQFVHEGTWMLIISILLSMVILLHLFRANLNFYSRTSGLKKLALLWVTQNFVLGISVFLRNYHYISFHGLAYKRIGVIVFLILVLVGLITLFLKVKGRKSLFFMARVNGWAVLFMLVGLTIVDWDSFIVRHNLDHANKGEIDIDNYLEMSDKVIPLLYADIDQVEAQMAQHRNNQVRWVDHLDPRTFRMELDRKRDRFLARTAKQDLLESNLADRRTLHALATIDGHAKNNDNE